MNIDAIDPEARIDREKASILLGYAAGRDGRLYTTDEAVDDWLRALGGGRFGTVVEIIRAHYASYDPKNPNPLSAITPGYIRHVAVERKTNQERREAAGRPLPRRKGRKMRRDILRRLQANGHLQDRDPMDYPED